MKYSIYTFLQLFLVLISAKGQGTIEYLGIEKGLSNDYVTNIFQDRHGFMWFGTYSGLNRYDGYSFKVYKNILHDAQSLPDNRITDIAEDKNGNLWVATKIGIAQLNRDETTFLRLPLYAENGKKVDINFSVHQLRNDKEGNIYAGSEQAGLLAIQQHKGSYVASSIPLQLPQNETTSYSVSGLCRTPEGNLWLVVQNVGLCYYDPQHRTVVVKAAGTFNATTMAASADGDVWFATNWGISRYNPSRQAFVHYTAAAGLGLDRVVHLYFGKDKKMWVGSDGGGIQKIDMMTGKVEQHNDHNKYVLTSNSVFAIYEDSQNRQWIGTLRGGINKIDYSKGKFQLIKNKTHGQLISEKDFVLSMAEADNENLWIGTDGAGLLKWNRKKQAFVDFPIQHHALQKAFVTDLIQQSDNKLWVSTYDQGLFLLDTKTGNVKQYHCYYPNTDYINLTTWRLHQDSNNQIWAATLNGGSIYKLDTKADRFVPLDIPTKDILVFTEESANNFWLGSWRDLIRIDVTTKKQRTFTIGTPVRFIHPAGKKHLWIGTEGGGLLFFNKENGAFDRYTEKEGLPSNTLLNALEDKEGNLWISTYNGLSKFDPKTKSFQNFSRTDGLQSNQFTYNAALKLRSGEMAFGGIRGFNIFTPKDIQAQQHFPKLAITQLQIDNKPYGSAEQQRDQALGTVDKLTIPYHQAMLSFSFAALEYTFPDKIKYAYFLEGWDKDWNYVGEQRNAQYTHLKEGAYTLRIKSTNADGSWNPKERIIAIEILPPWWRTGWAYSAYILLIVGSLYLYINHIKYKTKLLYKLKTSEFARNKEQELSEKKISFFTHIAHEFRTPLTLMVNPLKDMLYRAAHEDINKQELHHVYNHSKRLLSLVDKLLLFRKADSGFDELRIVKLDFIKLCREVYYCFQQLAHSQDIDYQFESYADSYEMYGDREKLEICLFNLFHNAIKYTAKNGKVTIQITPHNDYLVLEVIDSGKGIINTLASSIFKPFHRDYSSKGSQQSGFGIGLFLVKKFAEAHEGTIHFESNELLGTTFTLTLPHKPKMLKDSLVFEDVPEHSVFLHEFMDSDLPVDQNTVPLESNNTIPTRKDQTLTTEQRIILVVDDNDEIRNYVAKIFTPDYEVIQAEDGEKALEILRTIEPDIVISDVVMKDISGIDLCENIKANNRLNHIPVILLTASSSPDVRLKGIEGGADDYITKPFDKEILQARVSNLIQNKQRLHQYFHNEITMQATDNKIPQEYKDFLHDAMHIVEAHLQEADFSVKTLADKLSMSHSNLYRRIKSISGKSANEFIRYIRLRKVARTLIDTNANINEAAYDAGFSDIKHFRLQFTKLFGCTPSEYRKKFGHVKNKYQVRMN